MKHLMAFHGISWHLMRILDAKAQSRVTGGIRQRHGPEAAEEGCDGTL